MSMFKKTALAAFAMGVAAVAAAQTPGGPASRVPRGNGFGCQPPSVWVLESGGAICKDLTAPPPAPPVPPPSPVIPPAPPSPPSAGPVTIPVSAAINYGTIYDALRVTSTSATQATVQVVANGASCTVSLGGTCHTGQVYVYDSTMGGYIAVNADTVVNTRDYGMDYADRANIATVTMSATGDLTIWFYSAGNAADFALSRPQAHYAWSNGVVSASQWQGGALGVSIGGTWQ